MEYIFGPLWATACWVIAVLLLGWAVCVLSAVTINTIRRYRTNKAAKREFLLKCPFEVGDFVRPRNDMSRLSIGNTYRVRGILDNIWVTLDVDPDNFYNVHWLEKVSGATILDSDEYDEIMKAQETMQKVSGS